jgi:hypothetical protein
VSRRRGGGGRLFILFFVAAVIAAGLLAWKVTVRHGLTPGDVVAPEPPDAAGSREAARSIGVLSEVELYFSTPDGAALAPETRQVPLSGSLEERCRRLIEELQAGSRTELATLLPVEFEIRSLFVTEPVAVVDLTPSIRGASAGVTQEILLWYSIVNGLIMNIPEVKSVIFLVDGQETDTILGHTDMRGPFSAAPDLVRRP